MCQEQGLGAKHKGLVHGLAAQELDFSVRNVVNSVPCIQAQELKQSSFCHERQSSFLVSIWEDAFQIKFTQETGVNFPLRFTVTVEQVTYRASKLLILLMKTNHYYSHAATI